MKDEPRATKHQLNHAIPTVIHHPEEDMGVLARWVHQAMEDQTRFWTLIVGVVVVVVGLTVLASGLSLGRAASDEAWTELELAKTTVAGSTAVSCRHGRHRQHPRGRASGGESKWRSARGPG